MSEERFKTIVDAAKSVCENRGLEWFITPDLAGRVDDKIAWNLTSLSGLAPPPIHYLNNFFAISILVEAAHQLQPELVDSSSPFVISNPWQEMIKAAVVDGLFRRRIQPASIYGATYRPLLALASVCKDIPPWKLTRAHVDLAARAAKQVQASGKLSIDIGGIVSRLFDNEGLSEYCPLSALSGRGNTKTTMRPRSAKAIKRSLEERSSKNKLPTEAAFWEILRISYESQPISILDKLRFAAIKTLIFTGLRVNEVFTIPSQWAKSRDYFDVRGNLAGNSGGISTSLMVRYFGEKQRLSDANKLALFPTAQHVPSIFEAEIEKTLNDVVELTSPLRSRLEMQCQSGRIFPEFELQELISVTDLYTRLTGDPFPYVDPHRSSLIDEYKKAYKTDILDEIGGRQETLRRSGARIDNRVRYYFSTKGGSIDLRKFARDWCGAPMESMSYEDAHFLVDDLENNLPTSLPSKMSDTISLPLLESTGLSPADLLFLMPKRAIAEERNGGICDLRRYAFVGRMISSDLDRSLGDLVTSRSLFAKYSDMEEVKNFSINTHMFRHLQNTELFRLGVADTIITKRFNRKSLAQSYDYDHRSLAEELADMSIPGEIQDLFNDRSISALKLIRSGRAAGPIVDEFKRIQVTEGDEAAFIFLATEADGFHTTPYGHCLNSFTVDPCPKSLECYSGCRHLTATNISHHTRNLTALRDRYKKLISSIDDHPAPPIGKENMLAHAIKRLEGIEAALTTQPGQQVFPTGEDLFVAVKQTFKGPFRDA
ncbi:hypothetical protein [Ferrovibrio sp.]|uniref:hypothetical protein n=1 Tax=Ferrovibrio sp. TaxID=1917215 RepID=UPI0035126B95